MERDRLTKQIVEYYASKETKPAFFKEFEGDVVLFNITKEKIANRLKFRKAILMVNFPWKSRIKQQYMKRRMKAGTSGKNEKIW